MRTRAEEARAEETADRVYQTVHAIDSKPRILKDLFLGNHMEPRDAPSEPLPPGYGYIPYRPKRARAPRELGLTIAYHAHPGDISGDFASYFIQHLNGEGERNFRQVIMTRGEGASLKGRTKDEIAAMRDREEVKASSRLEMHPDHTHYMARADLGVPYPDGELLKHLPALSSGIKKDIEQRRPRRVILPSPSPDHPDHLAIYIAGMNAITRLRDENYFVKKGPMEIIACEPEFGVRIGQPHAVRQIPRAFGGQLDAPDPAIDTAKFHWLPYKYHREKSGVITPAADIIADKEELPAIASYPFSISPFIATFDEKKAWKKFVALHEHESQMWSNYSRLIPELDRLHGLMVEKEWGVGVYPIYIKDVTPPGSALIDSFPPGSVFRLATGKALAKARRAEGMFQGAGI